MECLSEAKLKTEKDKAEKTNLQSADSEDINTKKIINFTKAGSRSSQIHRKKRNIELNSPEFAPLKHYLNTMYGFNDGEAIGSKIVCIIEPNEDDYHSILAARTGHDKNDVECWHVHRRCFAWSFSVGTLIILLGLTCLLLGFLLPRHSALVNPMADNDEKMGTNGHFNNNDSSISAVNILDRKAMEHNNMLDTLKLCGGMASCFGCLLLLMTFILPPGSHPPKGLDEEEQPVATNINHLNEALRNCGF